MGPENTPPAFRRDPYAGLADEQVLAMAQTAFRIASALPPRSPLREAEWARYDAAAAELSARAVRHALAKIREHDEADPGPAGGADGSTPG